MSTGKTGPECERYTQIQHRIAVARERLTEEKRTEPPSLWSGLNRQTPLAYVAVLLIGLATINLFFVFGAYDDVLAAEKVVHAAGRSEVRVVGLRPTQRIEDDEGLSWARSLPVTQDTFSHSPARIVALLRPLVGREDVELRRARILGESDHVFECSIVVSGREKNVRVTRSFDEPWDIYFDIYPVEAASGNEPIARVYLLENQREDD